MESSESPIQNRLTELKLSLPKPPKAAGLYLPTIQVNGLLYTSGVLPFGQGGELEYTMQIGDSNIAEGQMAAKCSLLNALTLIDQALSKGLDSVERIIKLTGYVNSSTGFCRQPEIINAASQTLIDIWGEKGKHVRTAIGVSELPLGASVEIELIIQVKA